jgi:hypothetical protein
MLSRGRLDDSAGTVYNFDTIDAGTVTTLYNFDSADGAFPYSGLVQATNGKFYGTTGEGGTDGEGTVFSLGVGLKPFVETRPTSGPLGNNLTGATSVAFNGVPATFTIVSPSFITTAVPAGATTGSVQVTTPSHTLTSNVVFRVRP